MTQEKSSYRLYEEMLKFQESMDDIRLLKKLSVDLKSFRRMIRLRKYD